MIISTLNRHLLGFLSSVVQIGVSVFLSFQALRSATIKLLFRERAFFLREFTQSEIHLLRTQEI